MPLNALERQEKPQNATECHQSYGKPQNTKERHGLPWDTIEEMPWNKHQGTNTKELAQQKERQRTNAT